jgi:hypothetical protein
VPLPLVGRTRAPAHQWQPEIPFGAVLAEDDIISRVPEESKMTYRGKVNNGVVVLEGPQAPPDGADVSVRVLKAPSRRPARAAKRRMHEPSLYERLKPFIGIADDLPSDISVNHDHYLYGTPKRK